MTIDHSIHQMRGAEHGNLGFEMYWKEGGLKIFTKLWKIAPHLCSSHTDGILKHRPGKEMLIDMSTRWKSTFVMLQKLVNLKAFV